MNRASGFAARLRLRLCAASLTTTLITHPPTSPSSTLSVTRFLHTHAMTSSFPLLRLLLALAQLLCPVLSSSVGSLCVLLYSLPGTVDYPFSIAYNLQLTYDRIPVTVGNATYTHIYSFSNGTRSYTNRFGVTTSTAVEVIALAGGGLYSGGVPFLGATLSPVHPIQLPGVGPLQPASILFLSNVSNVLVEQAIASDPDGGSVFSCVVDPLARAYVSSVLGFTNTTITASNINSLAADYAGCRAPITFINGLLSPVEPSIANGALRFNYSYTISDGLTYSVTADLTITTLSPFGTAQDSLGNAYQTVTSVSGVRLFTNLTSGTTTAANVTGLSPMLNRFYGPQSNNTFYPYSLLGPSPGVYSVNTAPFWDSEGIIYTISPSATAFAVQLRVYLAFGGTSYPVQAVLSDTPIATTSIGVTGYSAIPYPTPLLSLQRQTYTLL